MSREERVALLDREQSVTRVQGLSIRAQTQLLGLNRSSLYYRSVPPSEGGLLLKRCIDEVYTAHPFYGSRRIAVQLRQQGWSVNRKAVVRHMQEMGLSAIRPGPHRPNLSKRAQEHGVYPYLLRGVVAKEPNRHSRYIVSWELSQNMEQGFVMDAARKALVTATPIIWNSDQGSQFTSPQYTSLLEEAGVQISMDGRGRFVDNIFTERLWRTIKYEEVYLHEYSTPREARQSLSEYIEFYNHDRPHQALGYQTPAAVYRRIATRIATTEGGNLTLENASDWS